MTLLETLQSLIITGLAAVGVYALLQHVRTRAAPATRVMAKSPKKKRERRRSKGKGREVPLPDILGTVQSETRPGEMAEVHLTSYRALSSDSDDDSNEESTSSGEEKEEEGDANILTLGITWDSWIPARYRNSNVAIGILAVLVTLFTFWLFTQGLSIGAHYTSKTGQVEVDQLHPHTSASTRYYTRPGYVSPLNQQPLPYVACTHATEQAALFQRVLPNPGVGLLDVGRELVKRSCVLERDYEMPVDQHYTEQYEHIQRPVPWHLKNFRHLPRSWTEDAAVSLVFVGADKKRYYRVWAVARPQLSAFALQPVVVEERELVSAARLYYEGALAIAKENDYLPNSPCLCMEDLGIYGSQLYLHYDYGREDFRLLMHVDVVRNLTTGIVTKTPLRFHAQIEFPAKIKKLYPPSVMQAVDVSRMIVSAVDPVKQFETPAGLAELGVDALASQITDKELGLLALVNLTSQVWLKHNPGTSAAEVEIQMFDDEATGRVEAKCYHHCRAMAEHALRQLLVPETPRPEIGDGTL
jgi:hypothetical protein